MSHSKRPKTAGQSRNRPRLAPPPKTGPVLKGAKLNAFLSVALAGATIALYSPVFSHRFIVWDDHEYVTANPHIRSGLAWNTIKWAFTATYASNWHPLTWLSHAIDYQLFALNPAGHHLDNVLIHALNAVLLFLLLQRLTRRVMPSLLVAALFALHPLNVESVAWVAERKNVLSTMFLFLAIGAYAWYAQKLDWRRYLLVTALFAAGLMAKPMLVTLPFILILLDYWPLGRIPGSPASAANAQQLPISKLVLEKIPWLSLSAASAGITLIAQRSAIASSEEFRSAVRIENALVSYALYLWKTIWPARLAVFYPHVTSALPVWQVILSALTLLGISTLVYAFRSRRYLAVGWLWFLGTLVPVIGLVQVGEAAMSDRYAYVPLIGIFIMIAWSYADWAAAKHISTTWQIIPALCALAAFAFVTSRQIGFWDSEYAVWQHTAEITEPNPYAHTAVGAALMHPDVAMTVSELQALGTDRNRLDWAQWHYEKALEGYGQLMQQNPGRYRPEFAGELANLGNVALDQHHGKDARQHYEQALQNYRQLEQEHPDKYLPFLVALLDALGSMDEDENRWDDARGHYEEALRIYDQLAQSDPIKYLPVDATVLINLAQIDQHQNQLAQARARYEEALSVLSSLPEVDNRVAAQIANVEASLRELDGGVPSRKAEKTK